MSDVEETYMLLLMLEMPTRVDTDSWFEHYDVKSYFQLAWTRLGQERMAQIRPVLPGVGVGHAADHVPGIPELNEEQDQVLALILTHPGRYMVSGRAGTGKSVFLAALAERLREQGRFFPIVLTPRGVAALNIKGQTLHRFFGANTSRDIMLLPDLYTVRWNLHVVAMTGREPFLIVDEYSMASAGALNNAFETLFTCNLDDGSGFKPFGNIPVVMFGVLGQIGPFTNTANSIEDAQDNETWIWNAADFYSFEQIQLIVRDGPQTPAELQRVQDALKERDRSTAASGPLPSLLSSTILTSRRRVAKEFNDRALAAGPFAELPLIEIVAVDGTQVTTAAEQALVLPPRDEHDMRLVALESDTGWDTVLRLKHGCRVMVTSNVDLSRGLVNGIMAIF
ncbi:hypothetical protein BGZ72_010649 [Mortierella alpina]|nr:hypothetical protein BGZ72_010649 [Mortierella alpina]